MVGLQYGKIMLKEYKILNKHQIRKWKLYNVSWLIFFEPTIFWDWFDFGFVLRVYKQNNIGRYHFAIDMQIAWFNLWLQCWRKN